MQQKQPITQKTANLLVKILTYVVVLQLLVIIFSSNITATHIHVTIYTANNNGLLSEGEKLYVGETQLIKWYKSGDIGETIAIDLVKEDNSYVSTIASDLETKEETYEWNISSQITTDEYYKIKISSTTNEEIYDYSNRFYIEDERYIKIITPQKTDTLIVGKPYSITWETVNVGGNYVNIELINSHSTKNIKSKANNDGEFLWEISKDFDTSTNNKIKITSASYDHVNCTSERFTIKKIIKTLEITHPSENTIFFIGEHTPITWESTHLNGPIHIDLYKNGAYEKTIINETGNDGRYTWPVNTSLDTTSTYTLKISSNHDNISCYSKPFTLEERFIQMLTNFSKIQLEDSSKVTITWASNYAGQHVDITLYKDNVYQQTIASSIENDGQFIWDLSNEEISGKNYSIKITSNQYGLISATTPYFSITQPILSEISILFLIIAGISTIILIFIIVLTLKKRRKQQSYSVKPKKQTKQKDETYYYNLALEAEKNKQYQQALTHLNKALIINEFFSKAIHKKNTIKSKILYQSRIEDLKKIADNYYDGDQFLKAYKYYLELLDKQKNNSHAKERIDQIHEKILPKKIKSLLGKNEYHKALNLINQLLNETPKNKKLLSLKQNIQKKINKNKKKSFKSIVEMGNQKKRNHIQPLITYTKSENGNDRRLAASALGKLSSLTPEIYSAVPSLILLLNDEKPQVRQYAIKALGKIGDKRAKPHLKKILEKDEKEYNRVSAKKALEINNNFSDKNLKNKKELQTETYTTSKESNNRKTKSEDRITMEEKTINNSLCETCKQKTVCEIGKKQKIVDCTYYIPDEKQRKHHTKSPYDEKYWFQKAIAEKNKRNYPQALDYINKALDLNEFFSEAISEKNVIKSLIKHEQKLSRENKETANWKDEVKNKIREFTRNNGSEFNLEDIYNFELELKKKFPSNNHIKEKIRQQLQILKDEDYLEFLAPGKYKIKQHKENKKEKIDQNNLESLKNIPRIDIGTIVDLKLAGYNSIDKIAKSDLNEIAKIEGIGKEKAKIILEGIKKEEQPDQKSKILPKIGKTYSNEDIQQIFKCSSQGGMRRSHRTNSLVLISKQTESVYSDFLKNDLFHYTGMGKTGNQKISFGQNKTLNNSNENNVDMHLFVVFKEKKYVYYGKVTLAGSPYTQKQEDENHKQRSVWVFPLKLENDFGLDLLKKDFNRLKPKFNEKTRVEERRIRAGDTSLNKKIEDNGKKIIQLKPNDTIKPSKEKYCIRVNESKIINCKYYDVRHPNQKIQNIIDNLKKVQKETASRLENRKRESKSESSILDLIKDELDI